MSYRYLILKAVSQSLPPGAVVRKALGISKQSVGSTIAHAKVEPHSAKSLDFYLEEAGGYYLVGED